MHSGWNHIDQEDLVKFSQYYENARPIESLRIQDQCSLQAQPESFYGIPDPTEKDDDRTKLDKNPHLYIGQLTSSFLSPHNTSVPAVGTATLIQPEELSVIFQANDDNIDFQDRNDHFQNFSQEDQLKFEIQNNYYCFLTCAHNVIQKINGEFKKCKEVGVFLGKKGKQGVENADSKSLFLKLNPDDILVPSNYKGEPNDGTDIALVGISKENSFLIKNFFKTQQSSNPEIFREIKNSLCLQNNKIFSNLQSQNAENYILGQYLLQYHYEHQTIFDRILNQNYDADTVYNYEDYKDFEIGVCGYPIEKWFKGIYPQVEQYQKFETWSNLKDTLRKAKQDKIVKYQHVKTSPGQSGSPIILKFGNSQQIIGVHTTGGQALDINQGTFFEGFLGLRFLFRDYKIISQPDKKFDEFLAKQKLQQLDKEL